MKSERIVILVEPKTKKALENESIITGAPVAEIIRRAIARYLKGRSKK